VMGRTGTDEFAPVAATQFPLEEPVPETEPPSPDCLYFSLGQTMFDGVTGTGHFLCDTAPDGTIVDFRKYYEEHSGSTSLGAPLDEMVMKDGVWVQHFETNELRCDERLSHPDDRLCGTAMASGGQSLLLDIAYRGEIKDARYGVLIGELKAAEPEVSTNWLGMKTADAQSPGVTAEQWLNPFSRVTASGTSGTYYAYFDENGHFALVAPVDTYSISISIAGHKTLKLPWEVRKGNTDVAFYTPEVGGRLEIGGELMIIPFGDMESKATLGLGALGILLIPFAAGAVLLGGVGILGARFLSKRSL